MECSRTRHPPRPCLFQRSPANKPVDAGTGVRKDLRLDTAVWPACLDDDQQILNAGRVFGSRPQPVEGTDTPGANGKLRVYMAIFYGALFAQRFVDIRKAAKVPEPTFQQVGFDTAAEPKLIAEGLP